MDTPAAVVDWSSTAGGGGVTTIDVAACEGGGGGGIGLVGLCGGGCGEESGGADGGESGADGLSVKAAAAVAVAAGPRGERLNELTVIEGRDPSDAVATTFRGDSMLATERSAIDDPALGNESVDEEGSIGPNTGEGSRRTAEGDAEGDGLCAE